MGLKALTRAKGGHDRVGWVIEQGVDSSRVAIITGNASMTTFWHPGTLTVVVLMVQYSCRSEPYHLPPTDISTNVRSIV